MSQHLSELGSLPDSSPDTHFHYQPDPILAHELEEVTYNCDDLSLESIVEWAGKQNPTPRPAVLHINIPSPDRTEVHWGKGLNTRLPYVHFIGFLAGVPHCFACQLR